jgi:transketolase
LTPLQTLAGPAVEIADAPYADALVQLGRDREDIVVLSADLSKYTDVLPFADAFPERFVQVGMAEQNMMGIAGGLAKDGFHPIAVTYGVFAARRAFEQVAMALCTGPSRAIVTAFLPGITTPFRATHQATDDLALMRELPGMTVIDPADATELAAALRAAAEHDGPVYLRGLRGRVERRFDPDGFRFEIGRAQLLRDGDDAGVICTGLGTAWTLDAAALLEAEGVRVSVLHVPTLKPFDSPAVAELCARFERVLVVENHSTIGGLRSAVAEALAAQGGLATRVEGLGVPDRWAPAGSIDHIRAELGLTADAIARSVREGMGA